MPGGMLVGYGGGAEPPSATINAKVLSLTLDEFDQELSRLDKTKAVNGVFRRSEWVQYAVIRPVR